MMNNNYAVISAEVLELINSEFPLHPGYIIEEEIEARKLFIKARQKMLADA
ncbi:MAG: hypothetical protein ABI151_09240 [Chitinophagaceae bacterium]